MLQDLWKQHEEAIAELVELLEDREKGTVNSRRRQLAQKTQTLFKHILCLRRENEEPAALTTEPVKPPYMNSRSNKQEGSWIPSAIGESQRKEEDKRARDASSRQTDRNCACGIARSSNPQK